ncbi:MAG: ABC transporter ATP-binding protein [Thermomicrobiales bacterium]
MASLADASPERAEPAVSMNTVLLTFLKPRKAQLTLSAILATIGTACQLAPYAIIAMIAGEIMADSPSESRMWRLVATLIVLIILRFVFMGAANAVSHMAAFAIQYHYRLKLADRMAKLPLGYFNTTSSGTLKKTVADDVGQMELYIAHNFPDAISAFLVTVLTCVALLIVDWRMAIAAFIPIVVSFLVLRKASWGDGSPQMLEYHARMAAMSARVIEFIQGLPVIKVFNRLGSEFSAAGNAVREMEELEVRFTRDFLRAGSFFFVFIGSSILTILPLGFWLYRNGSISLETLILFLVLGIGISGPLMRFYMIMHSFMITVESGRQILTVLNEPELPVTPTPEPMHDNSIAFSGVSFRYNDGPDVLHDLSFRVEPGTVTAIVGPSGSGKTTIARLVPRFWDVQAGSVEVGGTDVRLIAPDALMREVAFVFQEVYLFHDTVANNIRMGRPGAREDEVIAAAQAAARCDEFIRQLPNGYETVIGERGGTLSGGEKQRIALARAMLLDAPIVILDEATAFADPENESLIQEAISKLVAGKTLLIIAHRLSTITHVNQILVMERGSLVQRGTHQELSTMPGLYQDLWRDHIAAKGWSFGDHTDALAGGDA